MNGRLTAYHEAAHAVIGRELGLICGEATLASPDGLGHAHIECEWKWREGAKKACANAFCIALYAGAEAERVIMGVEPEGDGVDCMRARNALCKAGGVRGATYVGDDVWEQHEAKLRRAARKLVQQHRRAIEVVALALLERVTLQATEIDAIYAAP